jgi:hypothetical protein
LRDAWLEWDLRGQRWRIAQAFDTAWCHKCNATTAVVEQPIKPDPDPIPTAQQ